MKNCYCGRDAWVLNYIFPANAQDSKLKCFCYVRLMGICGTPLSKQGD